MTYLTLALILILTVAAADKKHPEASMDFMEICRYHNYLVDHAFVTTQDGYILRFAVLFIIAEYSAFKARAKLSLKRRNMLCSSSTGSSIPLTAQSPTMRPEHQR